MKNPTTGFSARDKNSVLDIAILDDGDDRLRSGDLAAKTGFPLLSRSAAVAMGMRHFLWYCDDCLTLGDLQQPREKPVAVDFSALSRKRKGGELLVKAVSGGRQKPTVLDATAGLGRDAFVLAAHGYLVTLVERNPVALELLEDGLRRGRVSDVAQACDRMHLVRADAAEYLQSLSDDQLPDVIYLDPMFSASGKSALVKKDMRLLQSLLGHGEDDPGLLALAIASARHRVVVKRAAKAAPLAGREPGFSLSGKAVRFDVYAKKKF